MVPLFSLLLLSSLLIAQVSAHSLVKRKAAGDKLYVLSNRTSCVAVKSESTCPVNWKLPPENALIYEADVKSVRVVLSLFDIVGASDKCKEVMKETLCSQIAPRCLPDGGKDYGDSRTKCEQLYTSACPSSLASAYKRQRFCEQNLTGRRTKSPCVSPDGPIGGACPQSKYKMPADLLQAYKRLSLGNVQIFKSIENRHYSNGDRIYSKECVELIKDFSCRPFYCSQDEKQLLIEHDYNDCIRTRSCFDEPLKRLSSYPKENNFERLSHDTIDALCTGLPRRNVAEMETPAKYSGASAIVNGHLSKLSLLVVSIYVAFA